jgi:periplasmic protein CpxP/Spy
MKYRSTFAFIVSMIVLLGSQALGARAQTVQTPNDASQQGPRRGPRAEFDLPNLNLTDAQKAQIESIRKTEREQVMAIRGDSTLSQDQKREKIRSIFESSHQQVFNVLTPQQQETLKNERHERSGPRGEGRRGGDPFANLGLTDQQKAQLKSIHESARQQVESIRNDSTLTADQKEAKLRSLHQSTEQQVSSVLTPEQREKLQELRHNHHRGFGGRRGGSREGASGAEGQKP